MSNSFATISPIDDSVYVERSYATWNDIQVVLDNAGTVQRIWKKVPLAERKVLCSRVIDSQT